MDYGGADSGRRLGSPAWRGSSIPRRRSEGCHAQSTGISTISAIGSPGNHDGDRSVAASYPGRSLLAAGQRPRRRSLQPVSQEEASTSFRRGLQRSFRRSDSENLLEEGTPMTARKLAQSGVIGLLAIAFLAASSESRSGKGQPIMRDLELEALQAAVSWPNAETQTLMTLVGRFIAGHRDHDAYAYFQERARSRPAQSLFIALEGFFQARGAGEVPLLRRADSVNDAVAKLDRAVKADPGLPRYFRGLVLAELPRSFRKAEAAVADLDWVLQNTERFPLGLHRSVYRGLARAYTTLGRADDAKRALERSGYTSLDPNLPLFTIDGSISAQDGFRFRPPRLIEVVRGVYVAQGYDFSDIAFVRTADGIVAIDAGTTEANARAALAAIRRVTSDPITHVILTHAHWDHIGGLAALAGPETRVIGQAKFADELRIVNETGVPFRYFFGGEGPRRYSVVPNHLVTTRETLAVGGTELVLYPIHGGETEDGLLIHLPDRDLLFVGDAFMPFFGAPFLPEGSPEVFFEMLGLVRSLSPRLLVHGHPPLTETFTVEALPGLEAALRELHRQTLQGIGQGRTLAGSCMRTCCRLRCAGIPARCSRISSCATTSSSVPITSGPVTGSRMGRAWRSWRPVSRRPRSSPWREGA